MTLRILHQSSSQADLIERDLDEVGKRQFRAELVADLDGLVVEIGAGTGLMLPHYPRDIRVVATEPDLAALRRAAERAGPAPARIVLAAADAGSLPFPPATFDAAVSASVLCTVPSVTGALRELHRVLRPGGRLRLLEHVRSDRPAAGLLMDVFNPVWRALNGAGCNLNRDVEAALPAAGFTEVTARGFQLFSSTFPAAYPYRSISAVRR
jgi:ubiquinone/menaquinone biosynthesis C-methylase UbiE